jgi:hypothetical protein
MMEIDYSDVIFAIGLFIIGFVLIYLINNPELMNETRFKRKKSKKLLISCIYTFYTFYKLFNEHILRCVYLSFDPQFCGHMPFM